MKKVLFGALLFTLATATSCKKDSSDVDQNKIYQSYSMTYDESTNKTTVRADFNLDDANGKTLELTGESSVTFNGEKLSYSGGSYSKTVDGKASTAVFVFTDAAGKTYTNNLTHASYISNSSSSYLDNSTGDYWYFGGASIASGESVTVNFTNNGDGTKTASFTNTTAGNSYITLTVDKLSVLPAGTTTAVTSRLKSTTSGNFTAVGGSIKCTYKSLESYIEVY